MRRLDPALTVVLLDQQRKDRPAATGLAAGGVRAQFSTEVNIRLSLRSIEFFEEFEQHTGVDPGFKQNGYLFVTATERGKSYLGACSALQRSCGVEVHEWDYDSLKKQAPYLETDDVLAANFAPRDGFLDPHSVASGFAKACGAKVIRAQVTGGEKGRVLTEHGPIDCGVVLLCPGHWAGSALPTFGVDLPIRHHRHMLAMTSETPDLPEELPMVVDLDTSFHFRREGRGLLIGCNWPCSTPDDPNDPALFDFGFLQHLADVAVARLPMLETIGFDTKASWAGYYAETPDRHAVIGEVDGVYVATGFGGHGIMHSPAAGEAIAELMLNRTCTVDVGALRPSRFDEDDLIVEEMVI